MKRLLAPLWYPPESGFAGGFYRAKRILESLDRWEPSAIASDTFPIGLPNVRRYPTGALGTASALFFKVMRAVNWTWSTLAIIAMGLVWREKFDVVYGGPSEILPISLSALVIGKLRGIPVVLCNQNVRDTEFWALNREVHRAADAIVTVSEALAEELRAEGLRGPIYIGTNGADDCSLPAQPARYEGVFVGRNTEAKGIFDLFSAWRRVCDARPDARLACAGFIAPNVHARLRAALRSLKLETNVSLLGPISDGEKWQLYAASRVCVFPSHVEGWGIVPIEAHLAGLPVVAYNLPAYRDTIVKSPGATLVPVGDVRALARATLDFLSADRVDRETLRSWARRFTWSAAAAREEQILEQALESVGGGGG